MSSSINKNGFTLVELMLAMSLFITVMIVATVGFVGINRTFSKGLVRKNLSEGLQRSIEDISRTVRVHGQLDEKTQADSSVLGLCSETQCYLWQSYVQGADRIGGLYKIQGGFDVSKFGSGEELLDERFVVDRLDIDILASSPDLVRISGVIRTNEDSAYTIVDGKPDETVCKGSAEEGASQNCALEKFNTVVRKVGAGS